MQEEECARFLLLSLFLSLFISSNEQTSKSTRKKISKGKIVAGVQCEKRVNLHRRQGVTKGKMQRGVIQDARSLVYKVYKAWLKGNTFEYCIVALQPTASFRDNVPRKRQFISFLFQTLRYILSSRFANAVSRKQAVLSRSQFATMPETTGSPSRIVETTKGIREKSGEDVYYYDFPRNFGNFAPFWI